MAGKKRKRSGLAREGGEKETHTLHYIGKEASQLKIQERKK